ncbi:hypothetical protein GCM10023088_57150 [Actinomadura verrucosospora]
MLECLAGGQAVRPADVQRVSVAECVDRYAGRRTVDLVRPDLHLRLDTDSGMFSPRRRSAASQARFRRSVSAFFRGQPRVLPGDPHQPRLARIQGGERVPVPAGEITRAATAPG